MRASLWRREVHKTIKAFERAQCSRQAKHKAAPPFCYPFTLPFLDTFLAKNSFPLQFPSCPAQYLSSSFPSSPLPHHPLSLLSYTSSPFLRSYHYCILLFPSSQSPLPSLSSYHSLIPITAGSIYFPVKFQAISLRRD